MDAQELRNLQEAYMEVVENEQLNELTPATPRNIERLVTKREKDARRAEDRTGGNFTPEYKKYFRTLQRQKVRSTFERPASRSVEPASTNEETDLYDIILSHLLDEGYADTEEAAEAIMVNMSEGWREDIVEARITRSTKEIRNQAPTKTSSGYSNVAHAKQRLQNPYSKQKSPGMQLKSTKEAFNIFINTMISEGMNFDSYSWDDLYEMFDNIFEADVANRDPDAYERKSRRTETKGQSAERRVRDRLATMDPDKKAAMIKQMRAVGLNV